MTRPGRSRWVRGTVLLALSVMLFAAAVAIHHAGIALAASVALLLGILAIERPPRLHD